MLHTVRRATSRSAGNLKQQDKCDNLSAFWPVAAAAARTKRTGAATSSPAPAPTPWHATTNSHKLLVLQQRNRETERGRGSMWHILHSIKLMSSKMEKQQRQQQAVAINACHAPLLGTPPGHGTASASAKNCCKMMWVVAACCGRRCCSCNFCCIFSSSNGSVASNLLLKNKLGNGLCDRILWQVSNKKQQ